MDPLRFPLGIDRMSAREAVAGNHPVITIGVAGQHPERQ